MGGLRPKPPEEAVSEEHVTALQARLGALQARAPSRLLKLAGLSEGIAADGAFARQARRKYIYAAEQISLCSTNHSQHVPPVRHALSSSVKIRPQTALFG